MLTLAEFLSLWDIIQVMVQDSVLVQHLAVPPPHSTANRNPSAVHGKQWGLTALHWGRREGQIFAFATWATSAQLFEAFSLGSLIARASYELPLPWLCPGHRAGTHLAASWPDIDNIARACHGLCKHMNYVARDCPGLGEHLLLEPCCECSPI